MIEALKQEAHTQRLKNLKAITSDITEPLPIEDNCIDVCLMATVLHIPSVSKRVGTLFNEIRRVLKLSRRPAFRLCQPRLPGRGNEPRQGHLDILIEKIKFLLDAMASG